MPNRNNIQATTTATPVPDPTPVETVREQAATTGGNVHFGFEDDFATLAAAHLRMGWADITTAPMPRRSGTLTRLLLGEEEPPRAIPPLREVEQGESIDVGDAMQLLEDSYRQSFDKKSLFKNVKTQVIIKEPDPVNDNEEVIVNYVELADVLATNRIKEVYGNDANPEDWDAQYNEWIDYYTKIILENKRKTNV